jgi:hypothetical protein
MITPVAREDIGKAVTERIGLPALNATAIDVWRVSIPWPSRPTQAESVGVRQRRVEVRSVLLVLYDRSIVGIQGVEEGGGAEDVGVRSSLDLRASPAATKNQGEYITRLGKD